MPCLLHIIYKQKQLLMEDQTIPETNQPKRTRPYTKQKAKVYFENLNKKPKQELQAQSQSQENIANDASRQLNVEPPTQDNKEVDEYEQQLLEYQDHNQKFSFSQPLSIPNQELIEPAASQKVDAQSQEQKSNQLEGNQASVMFDSQDLSQFQSNKLSIKSEKSKIKRVSQDDKVVNINNILDNFMISRNKQIESQSKFENEGSFCSEQQYHEDSKHEQQLQAHVSELPLQQPQQDLELDILIQQLYENSTKTNAKKVLNNPTLKKAEERKDHAQRETKINQPQVYKLAVVAKQQAQQQQQNQEETQSITEQKYESSPLEQRHPNEGSSSAAQKIIHQGSNTKQQDLNEEKRQGSQQQGIQRKSDILQSSNRQQRSQASQVSQGASRSSGVTFRKQTTPILSMSGYLFKEQMKMIQAPQREQLLSQKVQTIQQYFKENKLVYEKEYNFSQFQNFIKQEDYSLYELCEQNQILFTTGKSRANNEKWEQPAIKIESCTAILASLGFVLNSKESAQLTQQVSKYQKERNLNHLDQQGLYYGLYLSIQKSPNVEAITSALQFFAEEQSNLIDIQKTKEILSATGDQGKSYDVDVVFKATQQKQVGIDELFKQLTLLPY